MGGGSFRRGGDLRQAQLEGRAAVLGVLHAEAATGGGGEAGGQGEAKAQAVFAGLGGEEGFEQVLAHGRGDAGAVVAHAEDVGAVLVVAVEPELAVGLPAHGVKGVGDEVDQDLLQAGLVDGQAGIGEGAVQGQRGVFQARVEDEQRRVHGLAQAGLAMVVGAPGEGAQAGGDAAHAIDQLVDGGEVGAGHVQRAALEEAHGVAGEGAQGGQGLVEFVGDAGGHLPDHRQLAGLDQSVLGLAQVLLGLPAFADLAHQALVAGAQVLGAFGDLAFQFVVGLEQRLAGGEAGGEHLAPLVPGDGEEGQQGQAGGGQQAVDDGLAAQVGQGREQAEVPGGVAERPALRQVGDLLLAAVGQGRGEAEGFQAVAQVLARTRLPFVERPPVVLQAAGQALLVFGGERADGLHAQDRVAGEDDDAVLVADEGLQTGLFPALLQRLEFHLDHRDADDAAFVAQAVGQVVAGLARGAADAVEAPGLALHRLLEVGAEGQVFTQEAVGVAPVAGGQHAAVGVEEEDGAVAAEAVEPFEVVVDQVAPVGRGVEQQVADAGFQLQQAGQVGVAVDFALHGAGVEFQLAFAVLAQGADAGELAEVVADPADAEHGQDQQQGQREVAEQARFHGQCGRHGAEAGGRALHHKWSGPCQSVRGAERRVGRRGPSPRWRGARCINVAGSWRGTAGRVRSAG
ncbi:hypothetical protein PSm6_59060 [Pseudomonas solani]|uniref:Uncharacterized protein n=1 Tax=Pseudomonas solani TaxID=2731552 RepID=A0ABM7LIS3_9PSED|nr:hypothetical protein PSm6_59060 [Pseudomonas solani]